MIVSRDVIFRESIFPFLQQNTNFDDDMNIIPLPVVNNNYDDELEDDVNDGNNIYPSHSSSSSLDS